MNKISCDACGWKGIEGEKRAVNNAPPVCPDCGKDNEFTEEEIICLCGRTIEEEHTGRCQLDHWIAYNSSDIGQHKGNIEELRRIIGVCENEADSKIPSGKIPQCQICGKKYTVDLNIPDELWLKIQPPAKSKYAGMLCPVCIMGRIEMLHIVQDGDAQYGVYFLSTESPRKLEIEEQGEKPKYTWHESGSSPLL